MLGILRSAIRAACLPHQELKSHPGIEALRAPCGNMRGSAAVKFTICRTREWPGEISEND
jgi:hypothetical protein